MSTLTSCLYTAGSFWDAFNDEDESETNGMKVYVFCFLEDASKAVNEDDCRA